MIFKPQHFWFEDYLSLHLVVLPKNCKQDNYLSQGGFWFDHSIGSKDSIFLTLTHQFEKSYQSQPTPSGMKNTKIMIHIIIRKHSPYICTRTYAIKKGENTLHMVKNFETISSWQLHGSKTLPTVTTWRPCKSDEEEAQSYDDTWAVKKNKHHLCYGPVATIKIKQISTTLTSLGPGNWSKFTSFLLPA